MKVELTKNLSEQVPIIVSFYMTKKPGYPSYFESFGKKCVRDFVGRVIKFQDSIHAFFKTTEKTSF